MSDRAHYLITGGAGFLGHHLAGSLLEAGHRVTCLDNFSTGREENLAGFRRNPRFTLIRHDVRESYEVEADAIFSLACPASPSWYQKDPIGTLQTCFLGMVHALELAKRRGARLVQASTSEIYGEPLVTPQAEDYNGNVNPLGPRACYDEGKRCAETLCRDYARIHGVDARIARIFNTYGPGMRPDDGRVIPNFLKAIGSGEALQVFGSGNQTRAFCHVSDMTRGLIALMDLDAPPDAPVNLGSDQPMRIADLAALLGRIAGCEVALAHLPGREDDPTSRCPDISRAARLLGWRPQITLEAGLAPLVAAQAK